VQAAELILSGAVKRFGEIEALRSIDLEISAGEFFCLLGPSGAGKTTTLRAVAGLERLDAGRIHFGGEDLTHRPVRGRQMAMIFQTFALYPHLSVHDNLAYPLREARLDAGRIEQLVAAMAEMLGISHTLWRRPGTLSGGEQQRVAIGRALIGRPRLLLLDEPLTNLDAKLRHETRAEFKRLHRELGMTMLYATPDQLEALTMAQRIAVLREGKIVQTGTPRELYREPGDSFVATLVGAPRMNLIPGVLRGEATVALPFLEVSGGPWGRALRHFPAGAALWLGFRPQDVGPAGDRGVGPRFRATVRLTEPLGDLTAVDLVARGAAFKMLMSEERAVQYRVGDELEVAFSVENTHVFARDTGTAIR
jgi:multiple sugar transport system ATP-binding protein